MAYSFVKRVAVLHSKSTSLLLSHLRSLYCPGSLMFSTQDKVPSVASTLHLSPVFSGLDEIGSLSSRFDVIDDDAWNVMSGLAGAYREDTGDKALGLWCPFDDEGDHSVDKELSSDGAAPEYDDIEDMRVRGNLFYKMDKYSIESEECKYDIHGKKHSKTGKRRNETVDGGMKGRPSKGECGIRETTQGRESKSASSVPVASHNIENTSALPVGVRNCGIRDMVKDRWSKPVPSLACHKIENTSALSIGMRNSGTRETRQSRGSKPAASLACHKIDNTSLPLRVRSSGRTPTFNQLTAAYHEPFCLDIYISKGSVRASIIHRATSKVVVVAHSISKDMKLDLKSTRNKDACIAVGQVLAQRALEDDIHNAIFTPRKGEKLEGKLMMVLESVRRGGVDVKLKLKQKNAR